jgi:hypothetical protein
MSEILFPLQSVAAALGESPDTFLSQFVEQAEGEDSPKPVAIEIATERLKAVVDGLKARVSDAEKRKGVRERMLQVEAEIKAAYGIPATEKKEILPLIASIVAKHSDENEQLRQQLEAAANKGIKATDLKGLSDEDAKAFIANHPFHAESLAAAKAEVAAKEAALEEFKRQVEGEKITGAVQTRALELLDTEYRPKFTGNAEIDKRLRNSYLRELLETAKYKVEDGKITALDQHGEPLKNPANYLEMSFDQLALNTAANWFERHPVDPNKQAPGASGGKATAGVAIPDWSKMEKADIWPTIQKETDLTKRATLLESATAFLG